MSRVSASLEDPPDADILRRLRDVAVEHFDRDVRAREMEDAYRRFVAS